MFNTDWVEASKILLTGLTSAVLTGILAFAAQRLIERWFLRSLEKFKINLSIAAFEYQTRFTKIHEARVEVIAELHKLLVRVQHSLNILANAISSGVLDESKRDSINEKEGLFHESINAFWDYFDEKRLYLDQHLCGKISEFHDEARRIYGELYSADITRDFASYLDSDIERGKYAQQVRNALQGLDERIPPIRSDIEIEFGRVLGFSSAVSRTF